MFAHLTATTSVAVDSAARLSLEAGQ